MTITQSLGGSHTIITDGALARIADENADALGLERAAQYTQSSGSILWKR